METLVSRDTTPEEGGRKHARRRIVWDLPQPGEVKRYFFTSAQSNTHLFVQCWNNIRALVEDHYGGEIYVGRFTYNKSGIGARGQKKTSREQGRGDHHDEWWDSALEGYFCDERVEVAPGLVWCGELQILPTAVNPLSGFESYTGRDSAILPHTKFAAQSVPSPKLAGTKFIYTSGTVTLRNYIQKKAGQKAEFHHGYGGTLVEVDSDGNWYVRQLNADSEGVIYDLDLKVDAGRVTSGHRPEALIWGDLHVRQMSQQMKHLAWGQGGILDQLNPKRQVFHDVLDFRSRNHHEEKDFWKVYRKFARKQLGIAAEVEEAAEFLNYSYREGVHTVIVRSNHDEAFVRWLREADFRGDPENAELFLRASLAMAEAELSRLNSFDPIEWVFDHYGGRHIRGLPIRFLRRDEEYIVCPDANGGIELGMHGDKGANGAKGALRGFARSGRKCIVGDSHSAGIFEGAMQVGTMSGLDHGYNEGMSSWSHTNALVYPNGKRTLFTIWNGKFRA